MPEGRSSWLLLGSPPEEAEERRARPTCHPWHQSTSPLSRRLRIRLIARTIACCPSETRRQRPEPRLRFWLPRLHQGPGMFPRRWAGGPRSLVDGDSRATVRPLDAFSGRQRIVQLLLCFGLGQRRLHLALGTVDSSDRRAEGLECLHKLIDASVVQSNSCQ